MQAWRTLKIEAATHRIKSGNFTDLAGCSQMEERLASEMGTRGLPADYHAVYAEIAKMIDQPFRGANALKNGFIEAIVTCILEIDDSHNNLAF